MLIPVAALSSKVANAIASVQRTLVNPKQVVISIFSPKQERRRDFVEHKLRLHAYDTALPAHAHYVPFVADSRELGMLIGQWYSYGGEGRHKEELPVFMECMKNSALDTHAHRVFQLPMGAGSQMRVIIFDERAYLCLPMDAGKAKRLLTSKLPQSLPQVVAYYRDSNGNVFAVIQLHGTMLTNYKLYNAIMERGSPRVRFLDPKKMNDKQRAALLESMVAGFAHLHSAGLSAANCDTSFIAIKDTAKEQLVQFLDLPHLAEFGEGESPVSEVLYALAKMVHSGSLKKDEAMPLMKIYCQEGMAGEVKEFTHKAAKEGLYVKRRGTDRYEYVPAKKAEEKVTSREVLERTMDKYLSFLSKAAS